MISYSTAKVLLFLALAVGPKGAPTVLATSNSDTYVWRYTPQIGWVVESKRFPLSDFTRVEVMTADLGKEHLRQDVPKYLRPVAKHNWSHNSVMIFDNGDRFEKDGDHAYYIINAGAPNQQVYTILFPTDE